MEIRDIQVTRHESVNELSGMCGDFRLWYQFPRHLKLRVTADPFLAASLIPAMASGQDISIPQKYSVSPVLLKNIDTIQKTFLLWNKYYEKCFGKHLHRIRVQGGVEEAFVGNEKSVSFFSGGVDGLDTFLRHVDDIDCLLFVQGIDMQLDNETYSEAFDNNSGFLSTYEKDLVPVKTNVRFLGHHFGASWQSFCAGSGLASIALAAGYRRCFIASTNPHSGMVPDGSNAITDPLWSNGHTEFIYDGGEFLRIEKLQNVATKVPAALGMLRVCWQDKGYNCGACGKCLRTMLTLRLLGLSAKTLPTLTNADLRTIRTTKFYKEDDLVFFKENLEFARKVGDREVIRSLLPPMRRYKARKLVKDLFALVRGDFL